MSEALDEHLYNEACYLDPAHEARIDRLYGQHPWSRITWSDPDAERISREWFSVRIEASLKVLERHWIILPVECSGDGYGTAIQVCESFDDGGRWPVNGYVYATKDAVRKEYSVARITPKVRHQVTELFTAEIEEYNQYLTGEVYGYIVESVDEDEPDDADGEHIDSCWGFYGEKYAREEGERALEYARTHADPVLGIGEAIFI